MGKCDLSQAAKRKKVHARVNTKKVRGVFMPSVLLAAAAQNRNPFFEKNTRTQILKTDKTKDDTDPTINATNKKQQNNNKTTTRKKRTKQTQQQKTQQQAAKQKTQTNNSKTHKKETKKKISSAPLPP